jgi:hypothetical protein
LLSDERGKRIFALGFVIHYLCIVTAPSGETYRASTKAETPIASSVQISRRIHFAKPLEIAWLLPLNAARREVEPCVAAVVTLIRMWFTIDQQLYRLYWGDSGIAKLITRLTP